MKNFRDNLRNYMKHNDISSSKLTRMIRFRVLGGVGRVPRSVERRMRRVVACETRLLAKDLFMISAALDISAEDLFGLAYNDFAEKYNLPLQSWVRKDT